MAAVRKAGPELIASAVGYDGLFRDVYGIGGGLAEACETYMRRLDEERRGVSFAALLQAYEDDNARNWGGDYRTSWDSFRKDMGELAGRPASMLGADFWPGWLNDLASARDWGDRTFNDKAGLLASVWKHAVNRQLVERNPVEGLKRRRLRRKPVAVYAPGQVEGLLRTAWMHDRELVPFFAILIFAGLRPDENSEIGKLRWEDVSLGDRWIRVGAGFDNKTESKRFVPIEDNLMAWLEPWRGSAGPVVPRNLRRRRRCVTRGKYQSPPGTPESGWTELVPFGNHVRDITRHTYGSYLDARYRDRNMVMANMGHTSFRTYEQHYKNARTPQEAEAFWSILPPGD